MCSRIRASKAPLPVFVVAGQSNAFRLGGIGAAPSGQPVGAPVYFYPNPKCVDAAALGSKVTVFKKTQSLRGHGAGIAQSLAHEFPNGFALIRYAVCGSNLHTQWMPTQPDGYYHKYFEPFVIQGLKKIEQVSGRRPEVKGMFWHQGESNASSAQTVDVYGRLMPELITNFQKTYGPVPNAATLSHPCMVTTALLRISQKVAKDAKLRPKAVLCVLRDLL